jgi:hypothetical protein
MSNLYDLLVRDNKREQPISNILKERCHLVDLSGDRRILLKLKLNK